ncbi:MAG: OmpA family protein [Bacteroidota bacterium]|nr:OmpA family protein [Bacteroidota bacterium]
MKNLLLVASFIAFSISAFAQPMAHDRYTVSGGLLGAINFSSFRISGDNPDNIRFGYRPGWSAGAWLNLPLGHALSLEPQVMYSLYDYEDSESAVLLSRGKASYISVPVLLKIHPHESFAITLGPQFDFLHKLYRPQIGALKEDFESTSIGVSAGLELFPHEVIALYGRYTYGVSNLDAREPAGDLEYFNSNFQVGFKLRLFGKVIPADTDGDGISDKDDACPTVSGLASFQGCPDTDGDGITDASDKCPSIAGIFKYDGCPIPDTDKDGVNDEIDKCINVVGTAKYMGCPVPDTDGDGVNDENDKCISVAGLEKYMGCPIPDTDGDGVNDEMDKCPTVAGLATNDGCPNPDRDNDGVPDAKDFCPDIKGPASNDGCPVVENAVFNARMINFVSGKADLTARAKVDIKEGAKLLNSGDFKNLKVEIQGHTDNVGSTEYNHKLSHRRAESVRAELIKNGVDADRLTGVGFGEESPIATNDTADGKALNRRVVLKARQ